MNKKDENEHLESIDLCSPAKNAWNLLTSNPTFIDALVEANNKPSLVDHIKSASIPDLLHSTFSLSRQYRLIETNTDRWLRDKVTSILPGSIVYCTLLSGAEHSGVYIGFTANSHQIAHLNRNGRIEIVSPRDFTSGIYCGNDIYVGCNGHQAVSSDQVATYAREFLETGSKRDYNVLYNNCHRFTAGCIIGRLANPTSLFVGLKEVCGKHLGVDNWRIWDR